MVRTLSKNLLRRYRILRILFNGDATFEELIRECDLDRLEVVNALAKSQTFGDVKKTKIYPDGNKKKTRSSYHLTHTGERKLALFEYRDALYKEWSPVSPNLARPYVQEINDIIIDNHYFGHPPKEG